MILFVWKYSSRHVSITMTYELRILLDLILRGMAGVLLETRTVNPAGSPSV